MVKAKQQRLTLAAVIRVHLLSVIYRRTITYVRRPHLQSAKVLQLLLGCGYTELTAASLSAEFTNCFLEPPAPLDLKDIPLF